MARYRLSRPARADIARILATSAETWGDEGRLRYAGLLSAAMRQAAADPEGRMTRDRDELSRGLRSLHLGHVRADGPAAKVKRPVHSLYYRVIRPDLIEIVRVLHERMEPSLHLGQGTEI
ncbi:MAG TPA: type II toxin-antitoxin system RelE/ParE family toxin [Xanthobacteraceae bacterium]